MEGKRSPLGFWVFSPRPKMATLHHRFTKRSSSAEADRDNLLNEDEKEEENEKHLGKPTTRNFENIPWKGIALALALTIMGTIIVAVFICSQMGWIAFKPDDNFTFLTLAVITLVPGFYHCHIAYRAFRGYDGYSFDDIADLN